jgi:hypothetical protein
MGTRNINFCEGVYAMGSKQPCFSPKLSLHVHSYIVKTYVIRSSTILNQSLIMHFQACRNYLYVMKIIKIKL